MRRAIMAIMMILLLIPLTGCINEGGNVSTAPPTTTAAPTTAAPTTTSAPTTTAAPTTAPPVEIKEPVPHGNVEWMYYDDAVAALREDGNHILLFFWREQCPWCEAMGENTFTDDAVISYIQAHFHPVEVDIWSSETMSEFNQSIDGQFLGNLYKLYGAAPAVGFISPDEKVVLPMLGYQDAEDFLIFLEFVEGEHYKNMTYNDYLESRS